jgi:hypothetical protein
MKLSDPTTLWSFECVTDGAGNAPTGGLVLQDVRHDGHNFAKDVRLIGLWIEIETVEPSGMVRKKERKFAVLGAAPFTTAKVQVLIPIPIVYPKTSSVFRYLKEVNEALDFSTYFKSGSDYVGYGVRADYSDPNFFSSFSNCEVEGLTVSQIFLFSPIGNSPVHEPSGVLHAARCHPMVKFDCSDNGAVDKTKTYRRVGSIRFDYRIHFFIDSQLTGPNASTDPPGNNAGLFRDSDSQSIPGALLGGAANTVWNLSKAMGFSKTAFEAVEKPLVLEVTAPGLAKGFPLFSPTPGGAGVRAWDNIHWWGVRGKGNPMVSTPGAFHAAHLHWRWGAAAGIPILAGQAGNPHFQGTGTPAAALGHPALAGAWGPVIDPAIWIQSIRLAVAKNRPKLDPNAGATASSLSPDDWKTVFDPGLGTPADIYDGADIVLFFSVEVHREVTVPGYAVFEPPAYRTVPTTTYTTVPRGVVFNHGIFFAHAPEVTGLKVGSTSPLHWPNSVSAIRGAGVWFRTAG